MKGSFIMKKFRKICVMTSALIMALNLNIPAVSAVELQISSVSAEKTAVDYQQQASTLMGALDYIDKIGGGNISLDTSASFTDSNGNEFAPVVKTQFSTTSDLRSFMESSLTKKFINYRYSGILDTDDPSYIDYKGKLYGKVTAKGCGFEWTSKTPEIKNITDTSFDIIAEYDNYGTTDYMTLNVVLENGLWKINSISEVDYNQKASTLMGALDYIDKIGGGNISLDTSASFTDSNGNEFAPVVKTQFSTTSDLRSFMESSLTKKFINYRYSGILDTDDPSYIDYKGKLYGKVTAKGCGFEWTSKTPEIKNITDTSFDIIAEYDNYGTTDYMTLNVVLESGLWKINSIEKESDYTTRANELLTALNDIEYLGGSFVDFDMSTAFTDKNGNEFAQVVKSAFTSTATVKAFMQANLTDKMISERYSGIIGTDDPHYIDYKGVLYGKTSARGCGFAWSTKAPEIKNITGTSFDIVAEYDNYGVTDYMTLNVVISNGVWKINSLSESSASNKIAGDANNDGKVDVADVVAVASYVSNPKKNKLTEQGIINGDVHNSGNGLNANDALAVQQYLANIITKF